MDITNAGLSQTALTPLQQSASALQRSGPKIAEARTQEVATARSIQNQEADQDKQQTSPEELQSSVDAMNDFVRSLNSALQFSIDEDTGKTVVKVVDMTNDQVIRQIPSEEALAIAKALDKLKGLLIQQQA
ncbi:flagellar protein FlaG [Azovibrio restrictus]|uniref:flagellar protein FlaG n=1 Tax=Azovibrio restrictus TaxID=146938 RepID=UPI0026F1B818|nr:flagellar protein FlaG [Azovibrio restrictus]